MVVGAAGERVRALLPAGVQAVDNPDWPSGMGSSLRAGLHAAAALPPDVDALVVMLVDLPGVTAEMVRAVAAGAARGVLRRPTSAARRVIRCYWAAVTGPAVAGRAQGDSGARDYLRPHGAPRVPLGTAADGADVDGSDRAGSPDGRDDRRRHLRARRPGRRSRR